MTVGDSWMLEVRRRLGSPPPRRLSPREKRRAAVLVLLWVDAGELWTLLTKRSDELPQHKGQFAFPGGGLEVGEDPWTAALRESREEVGIDSELVLRLGELDEMETSTGFSVVPCVGALPRSFATEPNPAEIEEVFRVPVSALANPRLVEDRRVVINGVERQLRVYHVGERRVWGVTARILQNLLVRLGVEPDGEGAGAGLANPG